ncbi:MAG: DinB/UmuC family translesion DNA polymerase [Candidatus Xenobia bacterium]
MRVTTLYIPDFPVWVLRADEGSLRDREVLVHRGGKVIACTPGVRALGVELGWSVERASAQAAEAVVRAEAGGPRLAVMWEGVLLALNRWTPWLQAVRPGLAVAALEEAWLGQLSVEGAQVGVADDRATSLLAALGAANGEARVIAPGEGASFRDSVLLKVLQQADLSPFVLERLFWLGFRTVGSLARLTRRQLEAQFGAEGTRLHQLAHGEGEEPVPLFVPPPSVEAVANFDVPLREPRELEPVLARLVQRAVAELRYRQAQSVTVEAGPRRSRRLLHAPGNDVRRLLMVARLALQDVAGAEIDGLRVQLGGLLAPSGVQGGLWDLKASVARAVEAVEKRWPEALFRFQREAVEGYLPEEGCRRVAARPPEPAAGPSCRRAASRSRQPRPIL